MKKIILFDLDDTLYDYKSAHKKAMNSTYKILKKKINISKKEFDYKFYKSRSEIHRELSGTAPSHNRVLYFQRLVEKTHNTIHPEDILELYDAYWGELLKHAKLRKGVVQTLKTLKENGLNIGVITDLTTHIQLRKLSKLGLTDFVDIFVSSEEAGREKPHPSPFLLALNKLDLKPSEAMMVGDSPKKDIEGANSLEITSVHLDIGNSVDGIIPTYKIKKIPELLKIIEELNK
jgi:putative hydrolase of the HAD superfamily